MVARFHYEDTVLELLLHDQLRPQEQQDVTKHIETCTECQSKLETLAERGVDWSELRGYLKPNETATSHEGSNSKNSIWIGFLQPSDQPDSLGRFGRYEILEILGRGGTGIVMRGYDPSLDRQSAIKVLSPELAASAAARKRFSREAKSAAAVVHEHVVPIQTVDQEQGLPYLVMPVLEGRSLEDRIRESGPLEVKEVLRIGRQIAAGLAAAHQQGLVHRDVKPANILLNNGVERVVITDFGLARTVDDASMTQSGTLVGTPQYMSPEQACGETLDARSDLFSLGSVLYAMLVGHSPFRAETTMGVLNRITSDQPRSLTEQDSEIPVWLDQIVRRLLSKQPDARYQSAAEVETLLGDWLAHLQDPTGIPRPTEPPLTENDGGARRRNLVMAALGGFALLLAGIFVVLETNQGTITIQSDSDDVSIRITQGNEIAKQLTVVKGENEVRLAAGQYVVEIEGEHDGLVVKNGEVMLTRGDQKLVHIVESAKSVPANEKLFRNIGIGRNGNEIGVPVESNRESQGELLDASEPFSSWRPDSVFPAVLEDRVRSVSSLPPEFDPLQGMWKAKARVKRFLEDESKKIAWFSGVWISRDVAVISWNGVYEKDVSAPRPYAFSLPARIEVEPSGDDSPSRIVFHGYLWGPNDKVEGRCTLRGEFLKSGDSLTITISEAENVPVEVGAVPVTWELTRRIEEQSALSNLLPTPKKLPGDLSNYRSGEALPFPIRALQGTWTAITPIGDELKAYRDPLASVRFRFIGMNVGMQVADPKQNVIDEIWGTMSDHGYVEFAFRDQPKLKVSFQSRGNELTLDVESDDGKTFRSVDLPAKWQLQRGVVVRDPGADGKVVTAEPSVDLNEFQVFVRKRDNLYFTYTKTSDTWHRYQFSAGLKVKEVTTGDSPAETGFVGFNISGDPIAELVATDIQGNFCPYRPAQPLKGELYAMTAGQGVGYYLADQRLIAFSAETGTWDELAVPHLPNITRDGTGTLHVPRYESGFHPDAVDGLEVEFADHRQIFSVESGKWVRMPLSPNENTPSQDVGLQKAIGERILKKFNDQEPISDALAKLKGTWFAVDQLRGGEADLPMPGKAYLTEFILTERNANLVWKTERDSPTRSIMQRSFIGTMVDIEVGNGGAPSRIMFHRFSRQEQPQTLIGTYQQVEDDLVVTIDQAINPPDELGPLPVTWKLKKARSIQSPSGARENPNWIKELSRIYPPRLGTKTELSNSKPNGSQEANAASESSSKNAELKPEEIAELNRAYAKRVEKVQQQLHSETKIQFVRTPLVMVVGFLEKLHGISIVFDHPALNAAGIRETMEVSCDVNELTLEEGLRNLLNPLKLRHVIRDGDLFITTQADVKPKFTRTGPVSPELQAMQGHWQADGWRLIVNFNRFEFLQMRNNGAHITGRVLLNSPSEKMIFEEEVSGPQANPFGSTNQGRLLAANIDFAELEKGRLNLTAIDIPDDSSLAGRVADTWSFTKTKPAADPFADPSQKPTIVIEGTSRTIPDGTIMFRIRLFNNGAVMLSNIKVEAKVDSNFEVIFRTDPAKDIEGDIVWSLPRILPSQEAFLEIVCKPKDGVSEGTCEVTVTADDGFERKITIQGDKSQSEPEVDSSSLSRTGPSRSNSQRRIAPPEILLPELTPLQGVWQSEDWTLKVQFDRFWLQATGKRAGRIITGWVSRDVRASTITFDEEVAVGKTMDPFGPTERKRIFTATCDSTKLTEGRLQLTDIDIPADSPLAEDLAKSCTLIKGNDIENPFMNVSEQPPTFDLDGSARSKDDGTLLFVIRVKNNGYSALKNTSVKVSIDPNLQVVSRTDPAKDGDRSVVWSLPLILRNQEAVLEVVCKLKDGASEGTNEVVVTADGGVERSIKLHGKIDQAIPLSEELMKLQGHWVADDWMLIINHDQFTLSEMVDHRQANRYSGKFSLDSQENRIEFIENKQVREDPVPMAQAILDQEALKDGHLLLTSVRLPMTSPLVGKIQATWAFERAKQMIQKPLPDAADDIKIDFEAKAVKNPKGNLLFQVRLRNIGTLPLNNVTITELVDHGYRIIARTDPAQDVKAGVAWKYPMIRPGQEVVLELECQPLGESKTATNRVTVTADGEFEQVRRVKFPQDNAEGEKS